ncbi:MAG: M48 family metallopeptidase [Anaerolineales bacterium]|jgi:STE24 endopeptidase
MTTSPDLDPQRQEQARQYARISRRLMLVELVLGGLYLFAWLVFGWSAALRSWLAGFIYSPWLMVPAFAMVFGGLALLLDLPLSYYSGFVLPHRFGQSTQDLRGWIIDQVKGLLISAVFGLLILEIVYWLLREQPETWWLWLTAFMFLFNVLIANLAPVLLFPVFYKFSPLDEQHADLAARLTQLAQSANAAIKGVYQFDMSSRTKSANAALVGLGNTRRILLGDTLLAEFTDDEIETVMAHELGHHVHRDLPLGILVESGLVLVGFYLAALVLNGGVELFGFYAPGDIATLPLLGLVLGLYGLITMPLSNAWSRWRERLADRYALECTHNGPAFASAMIRLANQNLADADPESWVVLLLYSHPPLRERIEMAADQPW